MRSLANGDRFRGVTHRRRALSTAGILLLAVLAGGCGNSSESDGPDEQVALGSTEMPDAGAATEPNGPDARACDARFDSTYSAIQSAIFEGHGCTQSACHGEQAAGDLSLVGDQAYGNLLEVPSMGMDLPRIEPGAPRESYLYLKLRAAVEPGSVEIANSPMPLGLPALSDGELEAVRLWIAAGAPREGAVGDPTRGGTSDTIADLLDVCLPKAQPIDVKTLTPPAREDGLQFVTPPWTLAPNSEREICVATYYDFSDIVPKEYQSDDGTMFYTNGSRLRQDAGSHHWVLSNPGLDTAFADDPEFGSWTCRGGGSQGKACDPLVGDACGDDSICASEVKDSLGCLNFGPDAGLGPGELLTEGLIENVQASHQYLPPREGVYRELPIKGFLYHNVHAFNLTDDDYVLDSRLNVLFAKNRRRRLEQHIDYSNVYLPDGIPPFSTMEICADHVAPAGAEMVRLTSHTHKRGERFTVSYQGEVIYESLLYSDPLYKEFDPPLVFGESEADRTLRACATYNNGVAPNGDPDPRAVTRSSGLPDRTTCEPVACVSGNVGGPCSGATDHESCDSEPGAGDGVCDACPITGGPTTENEMFVIMPWYILPEG